MALADGQRVRPPSSALDGVVDEPTGQAAVVSGGVVDVGNGVTGYHDQSQFARPEVVTGRLGRQEPGRELGRAVQSLGQCCSTGSLLHGDAQWLSRTAAEGDAQAESQQHRKDEHPEYRLRLTDELHQPGARQLQEGMRRSIHP